MRPRRRLGLLVGGVLLATDIGASAAMSAGTRSATWDGRDDAGRMVPDGVYLVRLESGDRVTHGRIVLVR